MTDTKALFPIYQMMDKWAAFAYGTPEVKAHHHALYFAFVNICKNKGGIARFTMPYQTGMELAGFGSKSTYLTALKELEEWGFITYTPGANRFTAPIIEVHFCPSIGNLLVLYRSSIATSIDTSTSTSTDTSTDRIKELLDLKTKELEDLRTNLDITQTEAASLRSAVAGLESELELERGKVRQLEERLSAEPPPENNAQASRTRGARRAPAEEPPEFVKFYDHYPRREKRKDALSAWRGLTAEEQADAYDRACEWFRLRPDLADPARHQYIPLPASWLRGKRWNDQPPAQRHLTHVTASATNFAPPRPTANGYARAESRLDVEAAVSFAGALAVGGTQPR